MNDFSNFSNSAIQVLKLADEESRRLGHNFIGTEQILMGIVSKGENEAAKCLIEYGLTTESLQQKIENTIGRGSGFVAKQPPFTPRGMKTLKTAIAIARGKSPVTPEHLFKSILELKEGNAYSILKDSVDLSKIEASMANKIEEMILWRDNLNWSSWDNGDLAIKTLKLEVSNNFAKIDDRLNKIFEKLESIENAMGIDSSKITNKDKLAEIEAKLQEIQRKLNL
jgi:ATP-dependent Clp protease ATP-binding subunit ClpA